MSLYYFVLKTVSLFATPYITFISFYSKIRRVVYKGAQNQTMRENKLNNLHAPISLYMHTNTKM